MALVAAAAVKISTASPPPSPCWPRRAAGAAISALAVGASLALLLAIAYLSFGWNWLNAIGLAGENQCKDESPQRPHNLRPDRRHRQGLDQGRAPSPSTRPFSPISSYGPSEAATGCAQPPGPLSAYSWLPPGCSPGT